MSIADLYRVIKIAKKRPKAIAVSSETWAMLKKAGVIEYRTGHSLGLFLDAEKFPVLQGDITIFINPALDVDKKNFMLPPDASEIRAEKQERRRTADRRKGSRRQASDRKAPATPPREADDY